jgi:hypothetical protein
MNWMRHRLRVGVPPRVKRGSAGAGAETDIPEVAMNPKDGVSNVIAFPSRGDPARAPPASRFSCAAAHRCLTLMLFWESRGQHADACGEIRTRIICGRWHGQIYMPLTRETCALVDGADFDAAARHLDALFRRSIGLL